MGGRVVGRGWRGREKGGLQGGGRLQEEGREEVRLQLEEGGCREEGGLQVAGRVAERREGCREEEWLQRRGIYPIECR